MSSFPVVRKQVGNSRSATYRRGKDHFSLTKGKCKDKPLNKIEGENLIMIKMTICFMQKRSIRKSNKRKFYNAKFSLENERNGVMLTVMEDTTWPACCEERTKDNHQACKIANGSPAHPLYCAMQVKPSPHRNTINQNRVNVSPIRPFQLKKLKFSSL